MQFTLPRALLALALAAVSSLADYSGAPGGGITVTYPTAGTSLTQGQAVSITWTSSGIVVPLVEIRLLSLVNNQPSSDNPISIAQFVRTSDHSYNWTVEQTYNGGNVIEIKGLLSSAYSGSFSVQPAATSSSLAATSSLPSSSSIQVSSTSTRPPNSTTINSSSLRTSPSSLTSRGLPSGVVSSSATLDSTSSMNSTDPNAFGPPSTTSDTSTLIAVGITGGIICLAGVLYLGLRKTRRRRRPVSMPLIVEESAEPTDWNPPDWTAHNTTTAIPPYRRPPGYTPAGGYSPAAYAQGYYADPSAQWVSGSEANTSWPASATILSPPPAPASSAVVGGAASVSVPEEAHIREKTAVAANAKGDEFGDKPNTLE